MLLNTGWQCGMYGVDKNATAGVWGKIFIRGCLVKCGCFFVLFCFHIQKAETAVTIALADHSKSHGLLQDTA